ncbi:uncharacterized protein LOC128724050 [Anopheles nili]|uniref:uncharacterized protein LOC128724050 n=1 Tax=Anopheles nili TaxID=185578 RepID=UPI00237A243C|nr:uncharacterized protein LOC128724050 [Anopheles nili]
MAEQIKFATWNACSLRAKQLPLAEFLRVNNIDVVMISETNLKPEVSFSLPNHNIIRLDRTGTVKGGGVAIAVRRNISHMPVQHLQTAVIEAIATDVNTSSGVVRFVAVYCPRQCRPVDGAQQAFRKDISKICRTRARLIVGGDLNARHRSWGNSIQNCNGQVLFNHAQTGGFIIEFPDAPTFISSRGTSSTLDIFLVNAEIEKPETLDELNSDHFPVVSSVSCSSSRSPGPRRKDYTSVNWERFGSLVDSNICGVTISPEATSQHIDEAVCAVEAAILDAETTCVKEKPVASSSSSSSDSGSNRGRTRSSASNSDTGRGSITSSSSGDSTPATGCTSSDSEKAGDTSGSSVCSENDKDNESDAEQRRTCQSGGVGAKEDTTTGRSCNADKDIDKDNGGNNGGKPATSMSTGKIIEGNLGPLTATVKFINPYKNNWINADRLNELRKKVQDATKHHRVFLLRGSFHTVRRALVERGWVEKLDGFRVKAQASTSSSGFILEDLVSQLPERKPGESRKNHIAKCERSIMSRFLEHTPIDFLWTARREKADWLDLTKNASLIINRFAKAPFTTKEGLCSALHDFHWFYEEGMSETYFPRCYNVWNPEELNEFVDNFRLTASMGLLKWLIERHTAGAGLDAIIADDGNVPSTCITFALTRCKEYLDYCLHNDIDIEEDTKVWDHDWDVFLTHHYLLTHEDNRIQLLKEERDSDAIDNYLAEAKSVLEQIKGYWPQYALDGYLNIWIVKPGNKCRGRGIHLMNNIKQIIAMVNPPIVSKTRYVIQKYIERPLIIHNTKFDIRQWFMITSVQPLNIWFYKESYLRFSSQQYNLMNYHESVHLTNHAIQKKYHNAVRDERLPHENMWDCHTFQAYLRQIDKYEMWSERIYPGMQKAIIGSLLACQDNMDRRPNTFELYGADFMITEDFYPWLIEINSSPDLAPSTSVTARLCPQCVEDTIRVVIDRRTDSNAPTGSFELIYKQVIPKTPAYMGLNLQLRGHRITPKSSIKKDRMRMLPIKPVQNVLQVSRLATSAAAAAVVKQSASPVIMDLIECMQFRDGKPEDDLPRQQSLVRGPCGVTSATLYKRSNFSHKSTNLRYDFEKKKSYIISKTGELFRRNGVVSGSKFLTEGDTYIDSVEAWERATTSFFQHNFSTTLSSLAASNGTIGGRERSGPELSDEGQSRPVPSASASGTRCSIKITDCDDAGSSSSPCNSDTEKPRTASVENLAPSGASHLPPSSGFPASVRYANRAQGRMTTSNNFYTLGFSLRARPPKTTRSAALAGGTKLHHAQSAEDLPGSSACSPLHQRASGIPATGSRPDPADGNSGAF